MSGLTPILDTLLHQVLGRRGDVLPGLQKPAGQTVSQVQEAHVVRGPETETRPEPRFVKPAPGSLLRTTEGQVQRPLPSSWTSPPSWLPARKEAGESARITLSASARLISALLRDRGEGQPVIRPERSLASSSGTLPTTQQLAQRLGEIVRESGLFYESHLAKWYEGRLPTGELAREPQMKMAWALGSGLVPGRSAAGAAQPHRNTAEADNGQNPSGMNLSSPRDRVGSDRLVSAPAALGGDADAGANEASEKTEARLRSGDELTSLLQPREARDKLAAIVRHQLELLGSPNIRWEGELVSGLFMMMEIHVPGKADREPGQDSTEADGEESWGATFHIGLPILGNLKVSVQQTREMLSVGIVAEQARTVSLLKKRTAGVEERLREMGLEKFLITVSPARESTEKTG